VCAFYSTFNFSLGINTTANLQPILANYSANNCSLDCVTLEEQNCILSDWVDVTACSVTCGGGTKTQTRYILQPALFNGLPCLPTHARVVPCAQFSCDSETVPQDCETTCVGLNTTEFANVTVLNATAVCTTNCTTGLLPNSTFFLVPPVPAVPINSSLLSGMQRSCLEAVDCHALMGGVCRATQFYGLGFPPRCMCNHTAFFVYSAFRCVDLPSRLRFRILFQHPLIFREQNDITGWRPFGILPSQWFCGLGSCRVFTSQVELFTYDPDTVAAIMTPLTTFSVPLRTMHW
jgi:hypothetical protein